MSQITNKIMMIRPANFGFNNQTAENNAFQSEEKDISESTISQRAIKEFDQMVELLRDKGISVTVIEDSKVPIKPDAVFPNNWISFHENGSIITYPMYAPNRRIERREEIITELESLFKVEKRYSFEHYEEEDMFLEGTGSMILDRDNKIVYACLSDRTDIRLLDKFAVLTGYKVVSFNSVDKNGFPIYHTNVMMALGENVCILVKESITDDEELRNLMASLESTGKEIISIDYNQMEAYAGNMLQVKNDKGESFMIMSKSAYDSLTSSQINSIKLHSEIIPVDIETIENIGGGSVRCMMAEVFLQDM